MNNMPTQIEIDQFNYHKATGRILNDSKRTKPTNGKLVYEDGDRGYTVMYDAPFALLQYKRKQMVRDGYDYKKLKIRYL